MDDGVRASLEVECMEPCLVYHAIPGIARIVHYDVDFAIAELCRLLYQCLDICIVEHVTWD